MVEVQGLMSSCCKDSNRMGAFFKCSDQLSRCLTSDYFDKHTLEPKDVYEIPAYYLSMMLMSELPVKTELDEREDYPVWFIRNVSLFSASMAFSSGNGRL